jgi:hypothetical protein
MAFAVLADAPDISTTGNQRLPTVFARRAIDVPAANV